MNLADMPVAEIVIPPVLNPDTIEQLSAALESIDGSRIRFLLLRGNAQVFCNGLDIRWIAHHEISDAAGLKRFADILSTLHAGPFISIAIVEGEVTGGGMGIVSACDFVFATPSSRYSLTEGLLGFVPGIILPFLLDKISATHIKRMVFTGRKYQAETMVSWGLVHELVDEPHLERTIIEFIQSMKSCKPHAIGTLKKMLSEADSQRDVLVLKGVDSLLENLATPSVKDRLVSLAAYLSD